jgi:hypothetical protein
MGYPFSSAMITAMSCGTFSKWTSEDRQLARIELV